MANKKLDDLTAQVKTIINDPHTVIIFQFFEATMDDWKERLVNAKGDEVTELQGAIKHLRSVISDLQRKVKQNNFKNGAYTGT